MRKFILIVAVFFLVGGYIIYNSLGSDIETKEGKVSFIKEFGKWVFQVGKSTKNTIGYAIEQKWMPNINSSNSTIQE